MKYLLSPYLLLKILLLSVTVLSLTGLHCVFHEHGNGHGTDAAGDGGDFGAERGDVVEIDIADDAEAGFARGVVDAVDADVDDNGSGGHHVGGNEAGTTDGGDDDVGGAENSGEVLCARVAESDSGVAVDVFAGEEEGNRFANDETTTDDGDVFPLYFNARADEEFDNSRGRAGTEGRGVFLAEATDIEDVEAVHIFVG